MLTYKIKWPTSSSTTTIIKCMNIYLELNKDYFLFRLVFFSTCDRKNSLLRWRERNFFWRDTLLKRKKEATTTITSSQQKPNQTKPNNTYFFYYEFAMRNVDNTKGFIVENKFRTWEIKHCGLIVVLMLYCICVCMSALDWKRHRIDRQKIWPFFSSARNVRVCVCVRVFPLLLLLNFTFHIMCRIKWLVFMLKSS